MKAHLPLFVLAVLLLGLNPSTLFSQCAVACPSNDGQCNSNPDCCIVDTGMGGSSISDCIASGATLLRVRVNSTINSGDISGIQFCLNNNSLVIGENVTVDNSTCFDADGNFGVSITISGTTFTFNANDGGLDDLNTAIGNLAAGSTIGAVAQSLPVSLKSFLAESKDQQGILIEWVTSMESDNDYFLLEHSTDGKVSVHCKKWIVMVTASKSNTTNTATAMRMLA